MRLPALLALSPHRSVLPRGPRARQLGLDPELAFTVDGLTPALALMLDELTGPIAPESLVATAVGRGADATDAESLLHRLLDAGVVVDAGAGLRTRRRRAEATVVVDGDGPLAVGIAIGLARSGVGTVHTWGRGPVLAADLGTGYLDADRGSDRADALVRAVRRILPGSCAGPPRQRLVPDLFVLADTQAPHGTLVTRLMTDDVPHLLVRLRDGIGVVGPLVLPRRTACTGCLDLHRRDRDGGWPGVAAQLAGRNGRADPACAAATAALGTAQALAGLDLLDPPPPTLDATIELEVSTATVVRRRWAPRPDCPCGAALATGGPRHIPAICADLSGRETLVE